MFRGACLCISLYESILQRSNGLFQALLQGCVGATLAISARWLGCPVVDGCQDGTESRLCSFS